MHHHTITRCALATSILLASTAYADLGSDSLRINGFASVVGGMTLNQGSNADGSVEATFEADSPSNGVYDSDLSFKPDSVYGLQITSDLGNGLSVTGQIVGSGGSDFEADVAWAYIKYQFNPSWAVLAGRQRLPLYLYSDYLAVGYAYHWMRPPTEINSALETLDGINVQREGSLGNWDTRLQIYGGTSDNYVPGLGADTGLSNCYGFVYQISNDWLQIRASYRSADIYFDASFLPYQTKDDPVGSTFYGLATSMNFGQLFVVAEATYREFDDPIILSGGRKTNNGFISTGYRFGSLTPHITYSMQHTDALESTPFLNPGLVGYEEGDHSITAGLRWDFHPKAAFKVEYQSRTDDADKEVIAIKGNVRDIDLVSVGVDVIF